MWIRHIGGDRLVSRQFRAGADLLAERIRIIEFRFQLDPSALGLVYHQRAAALAMGPLRVPLPARLAPAIEATEEAVDRARMRVTVRVTLPLIGLLIAYGGVVDFEERVS